MCLCLPAFCIYRFRFWSLVFACLIAFVFQPMCLCWCALWPFPCLDTLFVLCWCALHPFPCLDNLFVCLLVFCCCVLLCPCGDVMLSTPTRRSWYTHSGAGASDKQGEASTHVKVHEDSEGDCKHCPRTWELPSRRRTSAPIEQTETRC